MEKAVILAAGRGTRMGDLTEDRPKPMIPLRGKPMLEHVLDRLREAGFTKVFLVTGYMAETIEGHFAGYPMDLTCRRQAVVDGTARAALLAREWVGGDPFLLTYGDILSTAADYAAMAGMIEGDRDCAAVLAAKWVDDPWQGAAIYESAGRVSRIVEKPKPGTSATHWNSAGIYTFREAIFDEFARVEKSPRGEYELTGGVERLLAAGRKVLVHGLTGAWRDVGRPEDIEVAEGLLG